MLVPHMTLGSTLWYATSQWAKNTEEKLHFYHHNYKKKQNQGFNKFLNQSDFLLVFIKIFWPTVKVCTRY